VLGGLEVVWREGGLADEEFERRLFEEVRAATWAALPLDPAQKRALIDQQHEARRRQYASSYPNAQHLVFSKDGEPVGALILAESEHEILIVDVSVLPARQGQGIGTAMLRSVIESTAKVLTLHVERSNPALELYARLGFVEVADDGMVVTMQRR